MRRKIIPYNPKLKELARSLRNKPAKSEVILWGRLKGKQIQGYDFHRQKPLLNYIVDFYCNELNLAIEIDGYSHLLDEVKEKDSLKETELNKEGITVMRFADKEIFTNIENVIRAIEGYIENLK